MFLYRGDVERVAARHRLDADLVQAICLVESEGRRHAWNPEPKYRWFWDVKAKRPFRRVTDAEIASKFPPDDFYAPQGWRGKEADAEWWGQQASWGLMQVMGAVAREFGFQEVDLPRLSEASYGLELGCAVLARRMKWAHGDVLKAAAAYNAGEGGWLNGQGYAAKVLHAWSDVQRGRVGEAS
jgi:hypothetical protein